MEEVYHTIKIIFKMIFYTNGSRAISKTLPARELTAELILGFNVIFLINLFERELEL
jgi:hypothetical protein